MQKVMSFIFRNLEAFIWIAAILYFIAAPVHSEGHFTICPLSLAGFQHCPGCGLGRAMILLLHGHFTESLHMHALAPFALTVLVARIVIVFRNYFQIQKHLLTVNNNESMYF
jgi:hypothetical protein